MSDMLNGTAAFEVRAADGHWYRIWSDGRTEGFGDAPIIINRIPPQIAQKVGEARAYFAAHNQWV
jgi:hypothetical protein